MADEKILYETDGALALITLNRPQVLNALDGEGYALLRAALQRFEDDPALRVAILTGAGSRAFSTGSDLKSGSWLAEEPGATPATEYAETDLRTKPVIAAIDGYCLGGGLEWALRCDLRIATARASFGLPEPRAGTLAGYGLHMLSRMIPAGEALYLQLTGARIDAQRALRCCLIQEIVDPPEQLLPRARALAAQIAECSPLAVRAIKQVVDFGLRAGVEDSYRFARPLAREIEHSEDIREGSRAFREKRAPVWKGR
jgi:enoyl-CoA hydratase/carnithine racemase